MPLTTEVWKGQLNGANTGWSNAKSILTRETGQVRRVNREAQSAYAPDFTQGAVFAPRLLFLVERKRTSALGLPAGRVAVISSRSSYEKSPWKDLPSVDGVVESEFVRPVLYGENLLPYRLGDSLLAVVPCSSSEALAGPEKIDLYPGLSQWWEQAERIWEQHRSSERLSLMEQLDYQSKLTKQLPIPPLRIVYNASGMHLCAAKTTFRRAIISKSLYWASVAMEEEANYLCAILNSSVMTDFARPFMSYGKDERHFDKLIWQLPIPRFDAKDRLHRKLVELANQAEAIAGAQAIDPDLHFAAARRNIRDAINTSGPGIAINEIVYEMLA
jgi:hypothetical protein